VLIKKHATPIACAKYAALQFAAISWPIWISSGLYFTKGTKQQLLLLLSNVAVAVDVA